MKRYITNRMLKVFAPVSVLLVLCLLSAPAVALTVDASDYGYNPTDSTAALQAAIDSGADTVIVPYMGPGNDWIIEPVFLNTWNQTIQFEEDVLVMAKEGSFHGNIDSMFHTTGRYITLSGYGATIQMRQSDYMSAPYTPSEFRMGVFLDRAQYFTIEGLTIKDTGGDGIYVGSSTNDQWCETITVRDVTIDNAYRNGISVISAHNLLVENSIIANTSGTDPQTGIDFEPNHADQILTNVNVRNTVIESSVNSGITFALGFLGTGANVTGSIENNTIVGNGSDGINYSAYHIPGVVVKDNLVVNNVAATGGSPATPNVISNSAFWGNGSNPNPTYVTLTDCLVDTDQPLFVSTDINDPNYYYLDGTTSEAIGKGASDGSFMGARGYVPLSLRIEEADDPSSLTPAGYTAYDFFATIGTNMGVMELILDTDTAGDIYQNSLTADDAAELFDTYVTVGYPAAGEQPANTRIHGGAVDLGGAAAATFTDQNIDIGWSPETAVQTGAGEFQIARIVLKNGTANNPWTLKGWQGGGFNPVTISGNISLIAGDVNGDGFVGGADLAIVLTNWGLSTTGRIDGDLDGNGSVGGGDYNEVLINWGSGSLPTEPAGIPEPTAMLVLVVGALAGLIRRR